MASSIHDCFIYCATGLTANTFFLCESFLLLVQTALSNSESILENISPLSLFYKKKSLYEPIL